MKRIHTFDEFEAKAARFRALMRQLHGDRAATEGLPQCDRTLGLLVLAREETPHTGELARDVADMRTTIHQLDQSQPPALRRGHLAGGRPGAPEVGDEPLADAALWREPARAPRRPSLRAVSGKNRA